MTEKTPQDRAHEIEARVMSANVRLMRHVDRFGEFYRLGVYDGALAALTGDAAPVDLEALVDELAEAAEAGWQGEFMGNEHRIAHVHIAWCTAVRAVLAVLAEKGALRHG